ncbi:MAG: hydrogen peroxide-inducible genes activator, partial [Rhodospirillaceae bacterium]|nr:hydrogen peroxide-inducible genes activator [Rhodospirillaceae bacterium]
QLRYLVAIAETLHFRRAAEMTHVTQPTLSGQLRELEVKLGVQLVERNRSGVILTPTGDAIAARARSILRDVQDIVDLAKQGQTLLGSTIRLGVLHSLGPYLLPHFLPELHKAYPDLRLYIREAMPEELLHGLNDGRLDLLLFPLPVKSAVLQTANLFREPLWVIAPKDHGIARSDSVSRADLEGETVLTLEPGHRLHDQVKELCAAFGADLSHDYEGTSLDTIRQMVGMGMGLSFLPALYVTAEVLKDDQIIARQLHPQPPFRTIGLVWRDKAGKENEFLVLADLIRARVGASAPEVTILR